MANRKRKTPPVAVQVIAPRLRTSAKHKKLLIDFDTGSAVLEEQHERWLRQSMEDARRNASFHVYIAGYASKLGDPVANLGLSLKRMDSVLAFLQTIEKKTIENVTNFRGEGESKSTGGDYDDSPEWRAVEVHIFIGKPLHHDKPSLPEIPLPNIRPLHRPLPGEDRTRDWEVASPGGAFFSAIVGGGFNIFYIKNKKSDEIRGYIQPCVGVGVSVSLPGLKLLGSVLWNTLTGVQYSPPDFTPVKTSHPVAWEEMESCLVRVSGASAGFVKGAGVAEITFTSAGVWQYNENGYPVKPNEDVFLFKFETYGENWQFGVNASDAVGNLVRIQG